MEKLLFSVSKMTKNGHILCKKIYLPNLSWLGVLGQPCGSDTLEKARTRLEVPFSMIQWPHITYIHLWPCRYTKNAFSYVKIAVFHTYVAKIGNSVLTKRSTFVDQNFKSCKGVPKLSLAIFIAVQTHFRAQKSLIYCKNR